MPSRITRTVTYTVHYRYPWCFDDGGIGHDLCWDNSSKAIEAADDQQAQLVALETKEFHAEEHCYHNRRAYVVKIVATVYETMPGGWSRTRTYEVPQARGHKCPCGKVYWPVRGEQACHALQAVG